MGVDSDNDKQVTHLLDLEAVVDGKANAGDVVGFCD